MISPYLPPVMTDGIVDVSHFDPVTDARAAKAAGIVAVICKATQGASEVDPAWYAESARIKAAGLLLGAYHFCDRSDPFAQADHFLQVAGPGIPLFIDAERNTESQVAVAQVALIARRIYARTGRYPAVYIGVDGPDGHGTGLPNAILAQSPLWLPEYGTRPICPPGWSQWWLWQFSSGAGLVDVPGIGKCDHNRFAGTLAELTAWWAGKPSVPAQTADDLNRAELDQKARRINRPG